VEPNFGTLFFFLFIDMSLASPKEISEVWNIILFFLWKKRNENWKCGPSLVHFVVHNDIFYYQEITKIKRITSEK